VSDLPNKLTKFWNELKRRKVVKVIILYSTTAFILLQLLSLVIEPLHLPAWTMTLFIILLIAGFPIAIIFSWIFDITPEGIQVTVASHEETESQNQSKPVSKRSVVTNIIIGVLVVAVVILVYPKIFSGKSSGNINPKLEKSIAVIPFIDDSPEAGNSYIINGLMESILNNLSKVGDLRVISRTSVEKYRKTPKLISEIANELNVNYIVEGSGQKTGSKIMLTVQLIDATSDKHLWSNQYIKDDTDILNLQVEVAKSITDQIQAIITPKEKERITKQLTSNQTALDYYYRGVELTNKGASSANEYLDNMEKALSYFEKAIKEDNEFAAAYAELAFLYYDMNQGFTSLEKVINKANNKDSISADILLSYNWFKNRNEDFLVKMNVYTDKALAYDPELDKALSAKAMYYLNQNEMELAATYFKKALVYNPNSSTALINLRNIYRSYSNLPDVGKFLEYALLAAKVEVEDSVKRSRDFYSLGQAFRWAGFLDEAEKYNVQAVKLDSAVSKYGVEQYHLLFDKGRHGEAAKLLLSNYIEKNWNHNWTLAMAYYFIKDYKNSSNFYAKQFKLSEGYNINNGGIDSLRYAYVLDKLGKKEESKNMLTGAFRAINNIKSNYKYCFLTAYYSWQNDTTNAFKNMREFAASDGYAFWSVHNMKLGPLYDNIRNLPEFKEILAEMETNFWKNHDRIKASLEEKGLL